MKVEITTVLDVNLDDLRRYTGDNMTPAEVHEYTREVAEDVIRHSVNRSTLCYFAWVE